jgi:hypothetical protein
MIKSVGSYCGGTITADPCPVCLAKGVRSSFVWRDTDLEWCNDQKCEYISFIDFDKVDNEKLHTRISGFPAVNGMKPGEKDWVAPFHKAPIRESDKPGAKIIMPVNRFNCEPTDPVVPITKNETFSEETFEEECF